MTDTPPTAVWVVEQCLSPGDYYHGDCYELAAVFATLDDAKEAFPSAGWTEDEVGDWHDGDATAIARVPVRGPLARCRHCHEVEPTHDPECLAAAALTQENPQP